MIFKWFQICQQVQRTILDCLDRDGNEILNSEGNKFFDDWAVVVGSLGTSRKINTIEITTAGEGDVKLASMRKGSVVIYIDVYNRTDEKDTSKIYKIISDVQENILLSLLRLPKNLVESVEIGSTITTAVSGVTYTTPWATFTQALEIKWEESRNY